MGRPTKYIDTMTTYNLRVKEDTLDEYRDIAQHQSAKAGKQVAMCEVMRPILEKGLETLRKEKEPEHAS